MFAMTVVWETLQPHPTAFKKKILKSFSCPYSAVSSTVFMQVIEMRDCWELQFPQGELV